AMTMTPARATSVFRDPQPGENAHDHREALPWWGIMILAGLATLWLGERFLGNWLVPHAADHDGTSTTDLRHWALRATLLVPGLGFTRIPTGFIPTQDKGYLLLDVQLADAASLERTNEVMHEIERLALETEGVGHILDVSGQSFILNAISSNYGGGYIILKPF